VEAKPSVVSPPQVTESSGVRASVTTVQNADELIAVLGEAVPHVCDWLRGAFVAMGPELMQAALQTTLEIEATGGLLTKDKSRRRAMAGVFLHVLGRRIPAELRAAWPLPKPDPPRTPARSRAAVASHASPSVIEAMVDGKKKTVIVEHVRRRGS
jgi:hypothetical protein